MKSKIRVTPKRKPLPIISKQKIMRSKDAGSVTPPYPLPSLPFSQGLEQCQLWTMRPAPVKLMRQAVLASVMDGLDADQRRETAALFATLPNWDATMAASDGQLGAGF